MDQSPHQCTLHNQATEGIHVILQLRTEEITWKQIDEEIVALDSRKGEYLAFNNSGALLWTALVSGATREQLVKILVDAYRIDPDRAAADAEDFVSSLTERGLLAA